MKAVLLAGGFGTRISEESRFKPKPMIEIGEQPILWHIMKHYSAYGFNEFIICLGYKSHMGAGSITSNVKSDKTLVVVKSADCKIETGLKKFGAMLGDFVEVGCGVVDTMVWVLLTLLGVAVNGQIAGINPSLRHSRERQRAECCYE